MLTTFPSRYSIAGDASTLGQIKIKNIINPQSVLRLRIFFIRIHQIFVGSDYFYFPSHLMVGPKSEFLSDSDPSKSFGFSRIRIRNTERNETKEEENRMSADLDNFSVKPGILNWIRLRSRSNGTYRTKKLILNN
jgi:hypothetical protein